MTISCCVITRSLWTTSRREREGSTRVYRTDSTQVAVPWSERRFWTRAWQVAVPNVWYLGITSLLTDVSSEMVASVLPMYLVLHLNLSPLAFGTLDGLYNGVTAITRWGSGVVADRWRRHKEVAAVGYAISAVCRLGLLAAGRAWLGLAVAIASDRLGKGIRTAPRDALISLSTPSMRLAQAFGVHRALDATGAMLGPVVAFALLAVVPRGFDVVFVTSFCVAIVGLGVLVLFVENVSTPQPTDAGSEPSLRTAIGLLQGHDFRILTLAAAGLALVTISDAFIYLTLQERVRFVPGLFPLLYVGTASSYLLFAIPAGWVADRFGRSRVFLFGHLILLILYVSLLAASAHAASVFLTVVLLGAYYAATDGVVVALASGILPAGLRGSGLALLTTATSLSRLVASIAFGWAWTIWGRETAVVAFAVALTFGVAIAAGALRRGKWNVHG
jgi:MFS family permease